MKSLESLSSFTILGVMVLCLISTLTYASSIDELIFGIEPWLATLDNPRDSDQRNLEDIELVDATSRPSYVPGEIIVSFEPGVTEEAVADLASQLNCSVVRKLRLRKRNKYLLKVEGGQTEEEVINQLEQNPDVLHAELNYIIYIPEPWFVPIVDTDPIPPDVRLINSKYIENVLDPNFYPYPRGGGAPPIEIDGLFFEAYRPNSNSYWVIHASDVVSSSGSVGSVNVVPEPTTFLLLGIGALVLRKRKRA